MIECGVCGPAEVGGGEGARHVVLGVGQDQVAGVLGERMGVWKGHRRLMHCTNHA